jgi:hypothetical protein
MDKQTFESVMAPGAWLWSEDLPLSMAEEFAAKVDWLFDSLKTS